MSTLSKLISILMGFMALGLLNSAILISYLTNNLVSVGIALVYSGISIGILLVEVLE